MRKFIQNEIEKALNYPDNNLKLAIKEIAKELADCIEKQIHSNSDIDIKHLKAQIANIELIYTIRIDAEIKSVLKNITESIAKVALSILVK